MADVIMRILSFAFPLACIWFSEDLAGYYRDESLLPEVESPTRGRLVRLSGWFLLLFPVLLFLLVRLLDFLYG